MACVNNVSTHTTACHRSMSQGVIRRLSLLVSILSDNQNKTIGKLFHDHTKALKNAGLTTSSFKFQTLTEYLGKIKKLIWGKKVKEIPPK